MSGPGRPDGPAAGDPGEEERVAAMLRSLDERGIDPASRVGTRGAPGAGAPRSSWESWDRDGRPAPAGPASAPVAEPEPDVEDDEPLLSFGAGRAPRPRTVRTRIGDAVALTTRTVGELAITFGVIILLFVVYELYFTGLATEHAQSSLKKQFEQSRGADPSPTPNLGDGIALMYAPRLGKSWNFVVVEGTGTDQLAKGPGHYEYPPDLAKQLGLTGPTAPPSTPKATADGSIPSAFPGGIGNFVVSGHRTTHAHPFFDANAFEPGDAVLFETTTTWYVYRVTGSDSVLPDDVDVAFPVPGKAGAVPTQKLLTLTTCNPRYSASHRLVIHGVLVSQQPLSAGNPLALTTGKA